MYFTREPIIETIISPKEGFKLMIRNSKGVGQEEFFVDSLEIVSFGNSLFFRSTERPKSFLVPVTDYEILEVRETRMTLKSIAVDRGIKIAGGRETSLKPPKESSEKENETYTELEKSNIEESKLETSEPTKKRERRRFRKRRGKDDRLDQVSEDLIEEEADSQDIPFLGEEIKDDLSDWNEDADEPQYEKKREIPEGKSSSGIFSSLLPPPTTLISETISRYKDTPIYAGAFYSKEEVKTEPTENPSEESNDEVISSESQSSDEGLELLIEEEKFPESDEDDLGVNHFFQKKEKDPEEDLPF